MKVTLVRSRATDSAVYKVADTLSNSGYDVRLLVWDRQGGGGAENREAYTTHRFGFKAPQDKTTVLFYLPIWWGYELFFLLRHDSDVIHACDLDTLLPAVLAKLIKRIKLCYTIYDFYADNLPKQIPRGVRRLVASMERFGIRFTDSLILMDEDRYEQVKGARISKIAYIYNSPPDYFDPQLAPTPGSEVMIFYAGVLHKARGLEYMISAVAVLDNVKLVIAGSAPDRATFESQLSPSSKFQYIGWIPYDEVLKRNLSADILFAFYDPEIPNNKYITPNKLFEAMMCGKPIITNDGTTASKIVKQEDCGLVVPYGDVVAIKEAILKLTNDLELRERLGRNGRKAYEERYNWEIMQTRLLDAYSELAKR